MYYATLKNNQLITQGHDGAQLITEVDGPGVYKVKTCRVRGRVVEFGSGTVDVNASEIAAQAEFLVWFDITYHKVEILCPANPADYAQKTR